MYIKIGKLLRYVTIGVVMMVAEVALAGGIIVSFQDKGSRAFGDQPPYVSGIAEVDNVLNRLGITEVKPLWRGDVAGLNNIYLLVAPPSISDAQLETELPGITAAVEVEYAELDRELDIVGDPISIKPQDFWFWHSYPWDDHGACFVDSTHHRQWNILRSRYDRAWAISTGDSNVVVAVLDTGMDMQHPELVDRICWNQAELHGVPGIDDDGNGFIDDYQGWDFLAGDNNPDHIWGTAQYGDHGTHMAGIIAAATNNETGFSGFRGIAGLTWKPKVLPLKCGQYASISLSAVVSSLNYIIDYCDRHPEKRIAAVNMSFVSSYQSPSIEARLILLRSKNVVAVGGAGNHDGNVLYPANSQNCVAMAWVDSIGVKATGDGGTAYGPEIDLCGFGERGGYGNWAPPSPNHAIQVQRLAYEETSPLFDLCGASHPHQIWVTPMLTSGATAQGSALAALIASTYPELSRDQIVAMMKRGGVSVDGVNPSYVGMLGEGYIDAYRSLTMWGTVERDTTLQGNVWVSGDVTVPSGVTLTIAAGTTIHVAPDDILGSSSIEFFVQGSLVASGNSEDKVTFVGFCESPSKSDWGGIVVQEGSGAVELEHIVCKNADFGVYALSGVSLSHAVFDSCGTGVAVSCSSATSIGPGVTVTNSSGTAVSVIDAVLTVNGLAIEGAGLHGLLIDDLGSGSTIDQLYVTSCTADGLRIEDGGVGFGTDVRIAESGNCGISAYGSGTLSIQEFELEDNATGLYVAEGRTVTIRSSEITGGSVAISCGGQVDAGISASYGNNSFTMGRNGLYGHLWHQNAMLSLVGNCFEGSTTITGIRFLSCSANTIDTLPGYCN